MIINYWPSWFRELYGGSWPASYCCIDVETTGYSFDRDVITEWGHCLVEDGKVVDQISLVFDWTNNALGVADHWLRNRLAALQMGMSMNGRSCHMSYERMRAEGMAPDKAMRFIRDFHATLTRKGTIFVAHNGGFDEKMLTANLRAFQIAPAFTFGDNGMLDTDGIEKASQILTNERAHPRRNDTLRSYFHRVRYTRAEGVKSNMDEHCYGKYLKALGIKQEDMHGAKTDSYCCHLLMQTFGAQITEPQTPPVFPTEDHKEARKPSKEPARTPAQWTGKRIRGQRSS